MSLNEQNNLDPDCAICLQKCYHPTRLPCGHVFCFLCVKGVTIQNKKCAMCRAFIPANYLDNPVLLEIITPLQSIEDSEEDYQWFYEGRNGWWKYDARSNMELESTFNRGESECTLLLAGALYSIDFQSMTQVKRTDPTRRRKVRRDTPLFPAKGIAGIKIENLHVEPTKSENELPTLSSSNELVNNIENNGTEIETSNPIVIQDDDVNNVSEQISMLNISEP